MPAVAKIDLSSLPDDQRAVVADLLREHAELRAANTALTAEASDLKQIVQRLEHLVAELNHVVRGKKSEKLSEERAIDAPLVQAQWRAATGLRGSRNGGRRSRGAAGQPDLVR